MAEIYPAGRQISVTAGAIGSVLEGASRPGHFDGVLTVVLKLLNIVRPDIAVFGRKDAQQLACIRRMVLDLNLDTDIVGAPIVREAGRPGDVEPQPLPESGGAHLRAGVERLAAGGRAEATPAEALAAAEQVLAQAVEAGEIELDYLAVVNAATWRRWRTTTAGPRWPWSPPTVGSTRLIDNVELTFPEPSSRQG